MSLFGYPATVTHFQAQKDSWNRVTGYTSSRKNAKVVEEQKLVRTSEGEEVISIAEIHLKGAQNISTHDYFEYVNALRQTVKYLVKHIEVKKQLGTDQVNKVIIYG